MSRTSRPIIIDAELQAGGSERDLSRWVEATRLIMKILELKRIDETVFDRFHFGYGNGCRIFLAQLS